jgi:hypothetical protein
MTAMSHKRQFCLAALDWRSASMTERYKIHCYELTKAGAPMSSAAQSGNLANEAQHEDTNKKLYAIGLQPTEMEVLARG